MAAQPPTFAVADSAGPSKSWKRLTNASFRCLSRSRSVGGGACALSPPALEFVSHTHRVGIAMRQTLGEQAERTTAASGQHRRGAVFGERGRKGGPGI